MKCPEWETKGILYFYNELEDEREYKVHIMSCKICQKNLEFLKLLKENIYLETPSDDLLENISQTSFEILKDFSSKKYRYIFNFLTFGISVALLLLVFIKKDIIRPKKKISVNEEIIYISERLNEIELSISQEEEKCQFRNDIEKLYYQIKDLSERLENL